MSANEERRPDVGSKFYIPSDDEGEPDQEMEIDEIMSELDGQFNVASAGDFYDIEWNSTSQRWEEIQ